MLSVSITALCATPLGPSSTSAPRKYRIPDHTCASPSTPGLAASMLSILAIALPTVPATLASMAAASRSIAFSVSARESSPSTRSSRCLRGARMGETLFGVGARPPAFPPATAAGVEGRCLAASREGFRSLRNRRAARWMRMMEMAVMATDTLSSDDAMRSRTSSAVPSGMLCSVARACANSEEMVERPRGKAERSCSGSSSSSHWCVLCDQVRSFEGSTPASPCLPAATAGGCGDSDASSPL
mmetsp:Transcript_17670/g.44658  ORF Transcript_17670/g.44658 Transcript_17670/m.44658 type:complete len:243 (-) Transcript_17670:255-983(-)